MWQESYWVCRHALRRVEDAVFVCLFCVCFCACVAVFQFQFCREYEVCVCHRDDDDDDGSAYIYGEERNGIHDRYYTLRILEAGRYLAHYHIHHRCMSCVHTRVYLTCFRTGVEYDGCIVAFEFSSKFFIRR